jgi:hypothetical protein
MSDEEQAGYKEWLAEMETLSEEQQEEVHAALRVVEESARASARAWAVQQKLEMEAERQLGERGRTEVRM